MKLNLLFIVMEFLTILIYPFVFIHGKLSRPPKFKESTVLANMLVLDQGTTGKQPIERI
jgi:hypothetical protein